MESSRLRVLIAGGGIAGLELLIALNELAPGRLETTLVAPSDEFVYRPLLVKEPFTQTPPLTRDLNKAAEEHGARFLCAGLGSIDSEAHIANLSDGSEVEYDVAAICTGAALEEPFDGATTLYGFDSFPIDRLIAAAAAHGSRTLALVVPPGVSWSLPLYETALLAQRRAVELDTEIEIEIHTVEERPLAAFGPLAADRVARMLANRGIACHCGRYLEQSDDVVAAPDGEAIEAGAIVALPLIAGPRLQGVPSDEHGFIPIDVHARVRGVADLYAAGDVTDFPIKQGGIGAQQADAAAEEIAARAGVISDPAPFSPVLRGKLLTGEESLNLKASVGGGGGEGVATHDYLWWPPEKVAGRYLAAWLTGSAPRDDLEPPEMALDVEVSLPREWHGEPLGP